jgi:tetratricopeptide (TPR) repeat protein
MSLRIAVVALAALVLALPGAAAALMTLRIGEQPPAFELADLVGKHVGSEALAGAPAVVVFWSTWSPRSAEVLDDFKRLATSYGVNGLRVVAINADAEHLGSSRLDEIRGFAAARELPFPVLVDDGLKTYGAWGVMAYPTEVVLDASGRIAYVLPGYPPSLREELEEQIRRVLGLPALRRREAALSAGYVPANMAQQHYNLGRQLLAIGDREQALAALRRAVAADPDFLDPAVMIARVSLAAGDLEVAEGLARQVTPEAVNRGDLRYLLGCLMLAKGELDAAEQVFRGLRGRLPKEGWWAWGLAQVELARGDRPGALELFAQARALQPDNPEGEAAVSRHFRDRWMRGETPPDEDAYVALFPALGAARAAYRKLAAPRSGGEPEAP